MKFTHSGLHIYHLLGIFYFSLGFLSGSLPWQCGRARDHSDQLFYDKMLIDRTPSRTGDRTHARSDTHFVRSVDSVAQSQYSLDRTRYGVRMSLCPHAYGVYGQSTYIIWDRVTDVRPSNHVVDFIVSHPKDTGITAPVRFKPESPDC